MVLGEREQVPSKSLGPVPVSGAVTPGHVERCACSPRVLPRALSAPRLVHRCVWLFSLSPAFLGSCEAHLLLPSCPSTLPPSRHTRPLEAGHPPLALLDGCPSLESAVPAEAQGPGDGACSLTVPAPLCRPGSPPPHRAPDPCCSQSPV